MIHEHNKDYAVCQDSIYIMPGYTTYIGEFIQHCDRDNSIGFYEHLNHVLFPMIIQDWIWRRQEISNLPMNTAAGDTGLKNLQKVDSLDTLR